MPGIKTNYPEPRINGFMHPATVGQNKAKQGQLLKEPQQNCMGMLCLKQIAWKVTQDR